MKDFIEGFKDFFKILFSKELWLIKLGFYDLGIFI